MFLMRMSAHRSIHLAILMSLHMSTHMSVYARARCVALYRLYIGIAGGMSIARVPACPYPRNGHAVGDAEIKPRGCTHVCLCPRSLQRVRAADRRVSVCQATGHTRRLSNHPITEMPSIQPSNNGNAVYPTIQQRKCRLSNHPITEMPSIQPSNNGNVAAGGQCHLGPDCFFLKKSWTIMFFPGFRSAGPYGLASTAARSGSADRKPGKRNGPQLLFFKKRHAGTDSVVPSNGPPAETRY